MVGDLVAAVKAIADIVRKYTVPDDKRLRVCRLTDTSTVSWIKAMRFYRRHFSTENEADEMTMMNWVQMYRPKVFSIFPQQWVLATFDGDAVTGLLTMTYYPRKHLAFVQYVAASGRIGTQLHSVAVQCLLREAKHILRNRQLPGFRCRAIIAEVASATDCGSGRDARRARRTPSWLADAARGAGIPLRRVGIAYVAPALDETGRDRPMHLLLGFLSSRRQLKEIDAREAQRLIRFVFLTAYADSFDYDPDRAAEYAKKLRSRCEQHLRSIEAASRIELLQFASVRGCDKADSVSR